jgi:glycine oxidase
MARVVVVGGGVIGCAVAERLTRDRHHVTLFERDQVGAHASGAAAGLLAPHSELPGDDLGSRSARLFPELVERIERASGVEVEYRSGESLAVAFEPGERLLAGRWLEPAEGIRLEPALNPAILGAALLEESQVTPPRFVQALARTAAAQGAEVRTGAPVAGFDVHSGDLQGVRLAGERLAADFVVLAAGPWTGGLATQLGFEVGISPRRGQLVALRPAARLLERILTWAGFYAVPKPDGSIVVGSTEEDAGFDALPTVAGVEVLLEVAQQLVPALGAATLERVWAALRPATEDGQPLIGPVESHPNLILASGHNRNGILLAPATAELVAEAIGGSWGRAVARPRAIRS